jgi:hypothetical protein
LVRIHFVGALATVGFLSAGFRSFLRGEKKNAQFLMRGRVIAQGFTVVMMCIGTFYGLKPQRKPHIEEALTTSDPK